MLGISRSRVNRGPLHCHASNCAFACARVLLLPPAVNVSFDIFRILQKRFLSDNRPCFFTVNSHLFFISFLPYKYFNRICVNAEVILSPAACGLRLDPGI